MTDVLAVVVNYNGSHLLADSAGSLKSQQGVRVHTVVADNASADDSERVCRDLGVEFMPMGGNLGIGRAVNEVVRREPRGEFIFIANMDIRLAPDCLGRLVHHLRGHPDRFAADPTQYDWDGRQRIHRRVRLRRASWFQGPLPGLEFDQEDSEGITVLPSAGATLVRRSMYQDIGGFDPAFFLEFEDLDLCWRAAMRGWWSWYVPDAVVYHKLGQSTDDHLLAAGKVGFPPMNRRRALSYWRNRNRWAIKTLPWSWLAGYFLREVLSMVLVEPGYRQANWRGRLGRAFSRGCGLARTLADVPADLRSRSEVLGSAVHGTRELVRSFVAGGDGRLL